MDLLVDISNQMELHSAEGLRRCFQSTHFKESEISNIALLDIMTGMYSRSPNFKHCVQAFLDSGLHIGDRALEAILLDDAHSLEKLIADDPAVVHSNVTQKCAYTPLEGASLLHVCAEYNHTNCAQSLLRHGADVNAISEFDVHGFGGQTPIFHTVNQNNNQSKDMLDLLLLEGADLNHQVSGLIWGKGFPWETFIPAVNPISYAMSGLLPQMHRNEVVISEVVSKLIKHQHNLDFEIPNIPNKYLQN